MPKSRGQCQDSPSPNSQSWPFCPWRSRPVQAWQSCQRMRPQTISTSSLVVIVERVQRAKLAAAGRSPRGEEVEEDGAASGCRFERGAGAVHERYRCVGRAVAVMRRQRRCRCASHPPSDIPGPAGCGFGVAVRFRRGSGNGSGRCSGVGAAGGERQHQQEQGCSLP